jgi:hypothetical protein
MKERKAGRYVFLCVIGLILFGGGLAATKLLPEGEGILKELPYLCVGVGAGLFGGNLGAAIAVRAMQKNPKLAKQQEIEERDERNQMIRVKAKAKAYDLMIYAYAAVLLAFSLARVEMYIILTLVAMYLMVVFTNVYYLTKYHKEM